MATVTSEAAPVGVFDSGLGGLSVLAELRALLPRRDFIYIADSGYCPYGDRSPDEIRARAEAITAYLIGQQVALVVVACNAATVAAIDTLRANHTLPFVGMEPAIKPAAAATRSGVVGVLATTVTTRGERVQRLLRDHANGVQVLSQPCPGLVECVESGALEDAATEALLRRYVEPLLQAGADTLVLGCTHYPFLRPAIRAIAGPDVTLIDSGAAVARRTQTLLGEAADQGGGRLRALTSGDPQAVSAAAAHLWPGGLVFASLPEPEPVLTA